MLNSRFLIMLLIFAATAAIVWYTQIAAKPPVAATRSFDGLSYQTLAPSWPTMMEPARDTLHSMREIVSNTGIGRPVAAVLVIAAILFLGYVVAYGAIHLAHQMSSGGSGVMANLVQVIVAPLWQVGLTFVSALQSVEWLQEKEIIASDLSTPVYFLYALISMVLMMGLARIRGKVAGA
ncbi:MAG TPA: hypothetical protein DCL54_13410 [Alphaproteobacteria bacterium]|nr:hypothetical protein [Alphaproteobacteria bacterium]HAJ47567.1 hypothetical protein [Alphaproteobacteria bacterium]